MGDTGDYIAEGINQNYIVDDIRSELDAVCKERDELKAELGEQCRLNGMGQERELKLITEVERLKERWSATQDDRNKLDEANIRLNHEAIALQAKLKLAVEALEKCEDGTLDAWQIGIVAADALKLIKGDGE
jgi:predicted nuclease with TOPRIM domain